jgi:hypothetical protein
MDKNTVLTMLDQERTAYMAFLELKRQVGDWPEVAGYAQKIMIVNEKIAAVKTVTSVPANATMGLRDAQTLLRQEANKVANKARSPQKPAAPAKAGSPGA